MIRRAADGLRARVVGPWTLEKLTYVERYAKAFMTAMAPKRDQGKWTALVYLDLLSGPGRCIDAETEAEFDGSPLRALNVRPTFNRLYFSEASHRNIQALRRRIRAEDLSRVELRASDCNVFVRDIVKHLSPRTLAMVFLDPEGFEVTFETLRVLATRQVDLLYLFPSGIGIARNLRQFAKQAQSPMDALWGGRDWRDLPPAKLAAGRRVEPDEALTLDLPWVLRFRAKMQKLGFLYQDEGDPYFVNQKRVPMYHLLFFSKHPAGLTIWRGIKQIEPSGQRKLPL